MICFRERNTTFKFYKELFPNDPEITLDDLHLVTIKNVLAIHPYNDLGILARDKLIVLVEAQSEWSVNVIFRLPEYYFDEMDYYIHTHHLDLHDKTKIEVPDVEAFIIYSGAGKVEKKTLSLKERPCRVVTVRQIQASCNCRSGK